MASYTNLSNSTRTVITRSFPTDPFTNQQAIAYNNAHKRVMTALWTEQETYDSLKELWVKTGDIGYLQRMVEHVTE